MHHKHSVSLQALSLFRIALGLLFLIDLVYYKLLSFNLLYSNNGFLNGSAYPKGVTGNKLSILNIIDNEYFVWVWFAFAIVLAIAYTVGYKTKYSAPLLWYAFYSICYKNVYASFGYNSYMLHLLFFSIFLPVGVYYAINKTAEKKISINQWAVRFVYIQIALVYFLTFIAKHGFTWWNGYATSIMMSDSITGNILSHYFSSVKAIYMPLNYLVLLIELLLPIFIIITITLKNVNKYIVLMLIMLHLPIQILANVGLFSVVGLCTILLFLNDDIINKVNFLKPGKPIQLVYEETTGLQKIVFGVIALFMLIGTLQFIKTDSALNNKKLGKYLPDLKYLQFEKFTILNQNWSMYAPNPPANIGWITIEAKENDNNYIDIFSGKAPQKHTPSNIGSGTERLMRFYMRYWSSKKTYYFTSVGWFKYHIKEYRSKHPEIPQSQLFFTHYSRKVVPQNNSIVTQDTVIRLNFDELSRYGKNFKR